MKTFTKEYLNQLAYFVPNLPRFEIDKEAFWQWWPQVNIPIKRLAADSRGNGGGYHGEFWDGVTIWQTADYQSNLVWQINYKTHPMFDKLINDIKVNLPWYDLKGITLWSNKKSVASHQDGLPRDNFPSAPRIMLFDDCDKRSFYLIHQKPFFMTYPNLQSGPNLFFFNNQNFLHGTTATTGGRKILIRIDGPLIDKDGFVEFLHENLHKNAKFESVEHKDSK